MIMGKTFTLSRLERAGGPSHSTLKARILSGDYPDARKNEKGQWILNEADALEAVSGWLTRESSDMLPLPEVARMCGLKDRSLNARLEDKTFQATCIHGRWFVPMTEAKRLEYFYKKCVQTGKAAKMLGYAHRRSIHDLMARGLPYVQIGKEKRIARKVLRQLQAGELSLAAHETYETFAKKMGLKVSWDSKHEEIPVEIDYKTTYDVECEAYCSFYLGGEYLCTCSKRIVEDLMRRYLRSPNDMMVYDGTVHILLHLFIEQLFSERSHVKFNQE
jgi:hypothetical protein